MIPYTPAGSYGLDEDFRLEMQSPWDRPAPHWSYDPSADQAIQHRGVPNPTKLPRGAYNPRAYFGRKLDEESAKRTPAGGTWHPAKSDQIWHGSDRAGADPAKWSRGGAAALRQGRP